MEERNAMPPPVLTLQTDKYGTVVLYYLLKPGQCFVGFAGRRKALWVTRATLIVRERSADGVRDAEYGIAEEYVWETVQKLINANKSVSEALQRIKTAIDTIPETPSGQDRPFPYRTLTFIRDIADHLQTQMTVWASNPSLLTSNSKVRSERAKELTST